jgi:diapolycopene oxygenase
MKSTQAARVGIIGGGLGGLAAACTLAARGYPVVLLERNHWLGGKAARLEAQHYRFDKGPTILTMPSVLRRIFSEAGQQIEEHLDLVRLDPQWRCFFADGSVLDLRQSAEAMDHELASFSPKTASAQAHRRFLELAGRMNAISQRFFFWRSVGSVWDILDGPSIFQPSLLRALLDMRPGRSVSATVRSQVSDARVAQMLDHFTQYVGSAPDQSPAVLCGIAHMQTNEGVWYPRGGTTAVPRALESLARKLGVELRCGVGVRRILLDSTGRVRGLETECGEAISLAAVVANSDCVRTHRDLIGGAPRRRFERRRRYEPACSGVVLYLGLDRGYEHLAHHNFVFSHNSEDEFQAIYRDGEPASDPTCYVAAPARTEPDVAPPQGEALYVLVHTPYLRPHHDWKKLLPAYRRVILDKLASTAGLGDLEQRIRFERWLTPQDIHDQFGVWNGAIYGLASHGKFLGAFKPSNRSPDVKGLYFAGGSAHPGPGMPMVLMSGWIAADALDCDGIIQPARGARSGWPPGLTSAGSGRLPEPSCP